MQVAPTERSLRLWRGFWQILHTANVILILAFWWRGTGSSLADAPSVLTGLGRMTGLLAAYFILIQFFTIGRMPWLERAFGLDRLTRIHHRAGTLGYALLLFHPLLLLLGGALSSRTGFLAQAALLLGVREIAFAAFALALFTVLIVTSIVFVRRNVRYEHWYLVHLMAYAALLFAFFHQIRFGSDLRQQAFYAYWIALYAAILGSHLFFRFARPLLLFARHRFTVERVVRENHNTVSVTITGSRLSRFRILPGQFMVLRFLHRGLWWQAHPFSLSCLPNDRHLRVTIKALGDFTQRAGEIPVGTSVVIDGPYGIFTDRGDVTRNVLCIAGGIGITPIRPLFEQVLGQGRKAVLLYANRTAADIVFAEELKAVAEASHARFIPIVSNEPAFPGEKGKLDAEKIRMLVPDVPEREVYLCGPLPMMEAVIAALRSLGLPPEQLHYEKFEL
ncbi:MAG: ferric reductase-like transmembrane domain-containing protein [Candidatus Peribacteraceae bacterium]|jgi:predicted ferric reductase